MAVRAYNNSLSLTSLGTTEVSYRVNDRHVYSFRIKGALYHNHVPLIPVEGERLKFAQIYIHDSMDMDAQVANCLNIFSNNSLDEHILGEIMTSLQDQNWLVQTYETAGEILKANLKEPITLQLKMLDARNRDLRVYNVPTSDEIRILIVGDRDE
ncbi:hypothetical protein L873DRAFT_1754692, partial [Choiromyces venosus 120613-1]